MSRTPARLAIFDGPALAGWALSLGLGLAVLWPILGAPSTGGAVAWLTALAVAAWLVTHLGLKASGTTRLGRDLSHERRFSVDAKRVPPRPGRRGPPGWYSGRSHAGEHPRFD